jgi:hypothetical protein
MATPLALALFGALVAVAAVAVWRRPLAALFFFVVGLAMHNLVMSLLWGAGVRGDSLELIAAWKEILLVVAAARGVRTSCRSARVSSTRSRSSSPGSSSSTPCFPRARSAAAPTGAPYSTRCGTISSPSSPS